MKKIFLLIVVAFLFTGCQTNDSNNKLTAKTETKTEAKTEGDSVATQEESMELAGFYDSVDHEEYKNLLTNPGNNLYYFYQTTCSHCNDFKPTMLAFDNELKGQEDVKLYLVDMQESANTGAWLDRKKDPDYDSTDLSSMKTYEDVKIEGTPTMIYVKDGEVVADGVGATQIEAIMTQVEEEFGIESQR